jgi:hypothetical protein
MLSLSFTTFHAVNASGHHLAGDLDLRSHEGDQIIRLFLTDFHIFQPVEQSAVEVYHHLNGSIILFDL